MKQGAPEHMCDIPRQKTLEGRYILGVQGLSWDIDLTFTNAILQTPKSCY